MTKHVFKNFWNDLKNEKRTSLKQKIWSYKRGFTSSKIIEYKLDENNYKNYLSDLDYGRLFPLNNKYAYWINDKLTMKYILFKYNECLPEYYYSIKNGAIYPSIDAIKRENVTIDTVVQLLKEKGKLAIKKITGRFGDGFYKVEFNNNTIYLNSQEISGSEFRELLESLDDYLVTEFIVPHKDIAKIYPKTANSLRIWVIKDEYKPAFVAFALLRIGTDRTGLIDNIEAGGLFTVIDLKTGSFNRGYQKENGILKECENHPDTGVPLNGVIPNWKIIVNKVTEIADYLSELSWMGFDVVITNEGLKILEINSHHSITTYQSFKPLLKDSPATEFLLKKLREKNLR